MQPNILITNSGTYSAVAYLGACVATDDKKVVFDQINFELEPTITACAGDQIELSSNANVDSVRWSNNESSMVVNQSGNYMATAYNGACVATDYQDVVFNSIDFTLGGDLQGCEGDFLELQADASYDSIKWNTGEASFAITATESGEYSATVYEGLCEASDSIQLVFYAQPTIDLGNNLERCENDPIQTIYLDDAYNYEWHDGSNSSYFDIVEPGLISVVAENNGCFNSDSLLVLQSNNCDCSVFIPSAFTPNNNSNNEVFKAVSNGCNVSQYTLTVYNRWGEKLFESNSIEHGWDGTYKDAEAQQGVYLFMLQHHMSGKNTYRSGTVTLLR
jgi:gliding motility-associated-like protein